ncbi:unnamed protein product [Prorocentrum cordatum]|uniref:CBM1 domain-containing protein n=1 Tax=Prorocentrum cordatum TaxID=2364126 RepID=A0ABN9T9L1_9DINO|nr:unnamed protein product [Polarella glacialis]
MGSEVSAASPDGFGFMCPSLMLGTAEMLAAAEADGYQGTYAVVTIDALSCGQCVEIENDDLASFPNAPKITAQVFNSVASSVDVYMAGGGLGANNGCAAVEGYSPMAAMYEKYPTSKNSEFVSHLKRAGYPDAEKWLDEVISYAGGLRGGRSYAECMKSGRNTTTQCQPPGNGCDGMSGVCITDPLAACTSAFVGKSDYVTQKAVESCMYAFEHDLHWNRPITYQVVPCPAGLTALTGMIPSVADESRRGERVKSTTTTMEDCCEPTCSRASALEYATEPGSWVSGNEVIYTCNILGQPFLESTSRVSDPCEQPASGAELSRQGGSGPFGVPPLEQQGGPSSAASASAARAPAPPQIPTSVPTQSPISAPSTSTARSPAPPQIPASWPLQHSSSAASVSTARAPAPQIPAGVPTQHPSSAPSASTARAPAPPQIPASVPTQSPISAPSTSTARSPAPPQIPAGAPAQHPAGARAQSPNGAEPGTQGELRASMGPSLARVGGWKSGAPPAVTARGGAWPQSPSTTGALAPSPADEPGGPRPPVLRGTPPPRGPRAQGAPAGTGGLGGVAAGASATRTAGSAAAPGAAVAPAGPGPAGASPAGAHDQQCPGAYEQCGGDGWSGAGCCQGSCVCTAYAESYAQCVPPDGGAGCGGLAEAPGGAVAAIVRKDALVGGGARQAPGGEAWAVALACAALGLASAAAMLAE